VTSGQCKLVAEIADAAGGFVVASGHPQFVGGAAARQQNIYTACMEANGFYAAGTSGPPHHLSRCEPPRSEKPMVALVQELRRKAALCRRAASISTSGSGRTDHILLALAEELELDAALGEQQLQEDAPDPLLNMGPAAP